MRFDKCPWIESWFGARQPAGQADGRGPAAPTFGIKVQCSIRVRSGFRRRVFSPRGRDSAIEAADDRGLARRRTKMAPGSPMPRRPEGEGPGAHGAAGDAGAEDRPAQREGRAGGLLARARHGHDRCLRGRRPLRLRLGPGLAPEILRLAARHAVHARGRLHAPPRRPRPGRHLLPAGGSALQGLGRPARLAVSAGAGGRLRPGRELSLRAPVLARARGLARGGRPARAVPAQDRDPPVLRPDPAPGPGARRAQLAGPGAIRSLRRRMRIRRRSDPCRATS